MKRLCVLGDGAWGTAVAMLLADNGYHVTLWCHDPEVFTAIKTSSVNKKYFPDFTLDTSSIHVTRDIDEAVCGTEWIFEAVPVVYLRSVIEKTRDCFTPEQIWVILSKGIEKETLFLPSQIVDDVLGYTTRKAVFSGPSFAKDLAYKQITAVTVAVDDCQIGVALQKMLINNYFCPYLSLDSVGTQVGGAFKNGIALGIGILDGAGYTDNVKAFFLTRGLHEMVTLAVALGGQRDSLYDLAGVGDLVLTAMGRHSKNVAFGKLLGAGQSFEKLKKQAHALPEGINTIASINQLANRRNLVLPLFAALYEVIFEDKPAHYLTEVLTHSPLKQACQT